MRRIFWGFCRNRFLIDPLHYFSSHSDFGFEFAEIFVIKKRLPDSGSRRLSDSASGGVDDSPTRRIRESAFECFKRKLTESESPRLLDSASRESLWSCYTNFLKFIIKLHHVKRLNQHFKGPIWPKISLRCNVLTPLIDSKVGKHLYL